MGSLLDGMVVISADGHVGPRTETYRQYLAAGEQSEFDEFLAHHLFRWTPERPEAMFRSGLRDVFRGEPRFEPDLNDCLSDPSRRLSELDLDGVAAEVLFPDDQNDNSPPWLAGVAPMGLDRTYPGRLRLAGARAYNRWLAEFCAAAPDRFLGQMLLGSLEDVDAAIAELHRAHASGLTSGIMLPLDYYLPLYHHHRYDAVWQTCSELGLTITIHAADGGPSWYGDGFRAAAIFFNEGLFYARRPLWCMIFGGIFERFPDLRVVFTEQGSSWVPELLATMDRLAGSKMAKWVVEEPLSMLPSELFAKHCVIGNSMLQPEDVEQRYEVGVAQLAWGSDFPHFEGSWPHVRPTIEALMTGVPVDEQRAILGGNLARAYRLDAARLAEIASRTGAATS